MLRIFRFPVPVLRGLSAPARSADSTSRKRFFSARVPRCFGLVDEFFKEKSVDCCALSRACQRSRGVGRQDWGVRSGDFNAEEKQPLSVPRAESAVAERLGLRFASFADEERTGRRAGTASRFWLSSSMRLSRIGRVS